MDRAAAATAYADRMTKLVGDLAASGLEVSHPLMEPRDTTERTIVLVLSSNRGFCGGYNGNVVRLATPHWKSLAEVSEVRELEVSGKRGINALTYAGLDIDRQYTQFEDKTRYEEIEELADRYLAEFAAGKLDRFDVVYTQFQSTARQNAVVETLLPFQSLTTNDGSDDSAGGNSMYEFEPSAESILEEVVPNSFKVKLFKCFLDAAVSEQVARMVAMKGATENAGELIKQLSREYNRARQSRITGEIMEILGGVEALKA